MRAMTLCCRTTIFVLTILGMVGAARADARTRFSRNLPADSSFAAFSNDVASTCAAFQQTGIGAALCGSAFTPLRDELAKQQQPSALYLRPAFGFDWSDLKNVHEPGGIAVFRLSDGTPGVAWLFAPENPAEKTPAYFVAAERYFDQAQYKREVADYQGSKLTIYRRSQTAGKEGESLTATAVLFRTATAYGVANSLPAAKAILQTAKDSSGQPAAADTAREEWFSDDQDSDANVSLFTRPFALWELLTRKSENSQEQTAAEDTAKEVAAENPTARAERLGYSAISTIKATLRFASGDATQWTIEAAIDAEEPYRGALRVLELSAGHLAPWPDWLGTDFDTLARWGWNVPLAVQGLGTLYDESTEPGPDGVGLFEDLLDGLRDDPEGVQVDLRRDLFEQLTPSLLSVTFPGATTPDDEDQVMVVGVRHLPKVQDTLTRFFKGDDRVKFRQVNGYQQWTVDDDTSLFVESENDNSVTVRGLALGSEQLVMVPHARSLERAIASNPHQQLDGDAGWRTLSTWLDRQRTDQTAYESLLRLERTAQASYVAAITPGEPATLRDTAQKEKSPSAEAEWIAAQSLRSWLWRLVLFGADDPRARPLCAVAPKFESLRAALPRAAITMTRRDHGWTVRCGGLRSEAKETP